MRDSCRRTCSACGQQAATPFTSVPLRCRNDWCSAPDRPLQAVYWAATYEGALRRAVLSYKYHADLRWAPVFAGMLHRLLVRHSTWFEEYALICPVPSFVGPGARRPWGHVELICAELSARAPGEWPVEHLVGKVAETTPMSATKRHERLGAGESLSRALALAPGACAEGRRVLVVDDVCASGQTLLAMARVLREAGAEEVAGLVVARASLRS